MSSFELLELFGASVEDDPESETRAIRVDWPPEDGAVAHALRNGERPEWKQAVVQTANESAVLRAAHAPGADASEYGSRLFLPISRELERAEEQRARAEHIRNVTNEPGGLYSLWNEEG